MAVHISEPATPELSSLVRQALSDLQIPPRLLGYHYLAYTLEKVTSEPIRINGITKDLYLETAKLYHTTWQAVEHNVRTAIRTCWERGGKEKLCEMAGHHLTQRPCATIFLGIVVTHLRRSQG